MKQLAFKIHEDLSFFEIIERIELAFKQSLSCRDDEGRYIARKKFDEFSMEVMDKIDRSSELLCDEHSVIYIRLHSDEQFNKCFEHAIKKALCSVKIKWIECIWTPCEPV